MHGPFSNYIRAIDTYGAHRAHRQTGIILAKKDLRLRGSNIHTSIPLNEEINVLDMHSNLSRMMAWIVTPR